MPDNRTLIYSAHSLQAFVDCERRFQLKYLERMTWPALPTQHALQYEQLMADGRRFHRMIEQDLLGASVLEPTQADSEVLAEWWETYGMYDPANEVDGRRFPEHRLVGTIGPEGPTLVAQYDLIVHSPHQTVIFDWKTTEHPPRREHLVTRLQTRVYRYLLASAGASLTGGEAIPPESIHMVYWFVHQPEEPVVFTYDSDTFRQDEEALLALIRRTQELEKAGTFERTEDIRRCHHCTYRSFCDRGDVAGPLQGDEADEELVFNLNDLGDLDAIEAIAFR